MPIWTAELTVDEPLVRRLIGGQFPEFPLRSVRLFAEGWDNAVWLVDEAWVFRFPRREVALPLLEREIAVLPLLAPLLELPIPVPTHVGRPTDEFPWPFTGSRLIAGREVAEASLTDADRARLARPMAGFLRGLHAPRVLEAVGALLPADSIRRSDMAVSVPRGLQYLAEAERLRIWRTPVSVRSMLADAAGLPPAEPTAVVHSDLHARHVLVGDGGVPVGVIDWGDMCRADQAVDLSMAFAMLSRDARADFFDAYGPVPEERRLRARVVAIFLCAVLASYAHHEGMTALEREAIGGLGRASGD